MGEQMRKKVTIPMLMEKKKRDEFKKINDKVQWKIQP